MIAFKDGRFVCGSHGTIPGSQSRPITSVTFSSDTSVTFSSDP